MFLYVWENILVKNELLTVMAIAPSLSEAKSIIRSKYFFVQEDFLSSSPSKYNTTESVVISVKTPRV